MDARVRSGPRGQSLGGGPPVQRWRPRRCAPTRARLGTLLFPALLFPALVFSALLFPALVSAAELRIGLYQNLPKIGWDGAGTPQGVFVDILEDIATREGWSLRYVPGTWNEGLERLERGDLDLMPDVARTAAREQRFAFHEEPVLSSWSQVYAREGTGIRALPDLEGRRIALLEGSVQEQEFRDVIAGFGISAELVLAADFEAAFRAVASNEADAVVTNRFYGLVHAEDHGLVDTAILFSPTGLYFAAPRESDGTRLRAIDRGLRRLKDNPGSAYYRSLQRWTDRGMPPGWPPWLPWVLAAAALVLVAALTWSALLKRTTARLRASDERQRRLLDELAAARDRAESADRLKSAFLATMSHELRTPLNSILGFTAILHQGLAGPINAEQEKQLGMVGRSAEHLLALINDILDLSKIEAGQFACDSEPVDVRASIERVCDSLRPQIARKGLSLTLQIDPTIRPIMSDRRRIEQILLNLLSNAMKFTDAGGIEVHARAEGAALRIEVRDTGPGIRPEDCTRLFQPFTQLDDGTTKRHEGTGLGLSISHRLATLLGGTLDFESVRGEGSTFWVVLPGDPGALPEVGSPSP